MRALISGITGTLGQRVSRILLDQGHEVVGYSRDEQKQRAMPKHERLKLVIGDVRDTERLIFSSRGVDRIYHFAAMKCVDQIEECPLEAIKTNIDGTESVMCAQDVNSIKRVVLASTDKAAYPINAYGSTKALAEKLVLQNPKNVVCRYGNVLASRGSVIHAFLKTLDLGYVEITDPEMTRFFITIDGAAEFVVGRAEAPHGGLYTPDMKACRVVDLARVTASLMGRYVYEQRIVGIRPGEKLHEALVMAHEGPEVFSNTAPRYSDDELRDIVRAVCPS